MEFRFKIKISDLILQLHLIIYNTVNLNWRENVVRLNFQDFVFVGFQFIMPYFAKW